MDHRPRSTSRDLERYAGLFAVRTRDMKSSVMRDLMAVIARPEVISLAGGLPDTTTFPPGELAELLAGVAQTASAKALQYGPTEGFDEVVDVVAEVMAAEGIDGIDRDDVLLTTGGQQVLDLVAKSLLDPGDVVVAEAPSYPGALSVWQSYQADVVQVEMDAHGWRVDLLEDTLDRLEAEGRRVKLLYTVPTFQNPGGVTMSLERRRRLVEIARRRELLVLEDNPYGLLRFEGDPLPPLRALDEDYVVYCGTFSKILSPGLRLGWAVGPRPVLDKMQVGKGATDLCSSSLSQAFVVAYFANGHWRRYVEQLCELYRRRRDTMLDALAEHLPREATWTHPEGGMFIWATLPDWVDTTDLLARGLREHVAFVPGRGAYADGRGGSEMRLSFASVPDAEIREGVRRVGKVVREQLELYSTLSGSGAAAPAKRTAPEGVVELEARRKRKSA